jgi:hypothetical protein
MSLRPWDGASRSPLARTGTRQPELVALPTELPTLGQLFTFARDAEQRFETLRLQIEERTFGARGEQRTLIDAVIRHPGTARVTTSDQARGTKGNFEVWVSDGETVQTFNGTTRVGTNRPVRRAIRGLESRDLPGSSTVYVPITDLPMETLPELFVHPAGFCQNVLATGDARIAGTVDHLGREQLVVESDHPRTVEVSADRPDHAFQVWFDRDTGIISRLVETIAGQITRDAIATVLEPDAALPPNAFLFTFPSDARMLF